MSFPFIAPIKPWVKKKLEDREKLSYENFRLSPFVIMSSGAVVTKADDANVKKLIKDGSYDKSTSFRGCVISNQSEFSKLYQTSDTILGYDLDGVPIVIKGETNRKISTPIIQSVEIDTDGGNNTLKEAHIKIKCFSLKQLEMFDLFFCRPSMNVILEYGWNTDIVGKTDIDTLLFAKKKHDVYVKEFAALFDDAKIAKSNYVANLEKTDGNYDYMAGKVTGFNYGPTEDGTYDITLDISAGNELQLWMPIKQTNTDSSIPKKGTNEEPPYNTWLRRVSADFNLPNIIALDETTWKNEFFNWHMMNAKEKDKVVSYDEYVSFKLLLELLQNSQSFKSNSEKIKINYFENGDKTKPVIPMNSDKFMISSSDDIILPNKLPKFNFISDANKKNVLVIDGDPTEDCSINGKSFNLKDVNILKDLNDVAKNLSSDKVYGNLLNVFFKYEAVLSIYNQSFSQADFINGILGLVNDNTYGLCKLELMTINDEGGPGGKALQIMDYKLYTKPESITEQQKAYRFKIGPIGSIVREFSFSMELGELAQAQALYQAQLNLDNIMAGQELTGSNNTELKDDAYTLFDMSYARNSDGYFSVNEVEKAIVVNAAVNNKQKSTTFNLTPQAKKGEASKETENLQEVVKRKSIKFKIGKENKTLIFLDKGLIKEKINPEKKGSALTFLEISLAIDGLAGLSCGEYFQIDGIPETYNKNGIFQITNVKQGLDDSGWKTTIEAGYRINVEAVSPKS
jgi:hypothetical protein